MTSVTNTAAPSKEELQKAYLQTDLIYAGMDFNQALDCEAVNRCLNRIALNLRNKQQTAQAKPKQQPRKTVTSTPPSTKKYWWLNY